MKNFKKSLIKLIASGKQEAAQPFFNSLVRIEDDNEIVKIIFRNIDEQDLSIAMLEKYKNSSDSSFRTYIWETMLQKEPQRYKDLIASYKTATVKDKMFIIDLLKHSIQTAEVNQFVYNILNTENNEEIKAVCIRALSYWTDNPRIESIVFQYKSSANENVIKEVINALARLGKNQQMIELIYMDNVSEANKLLIINHIKDVQELSTIPTLMKMLKDTDNMLIRVGVIRALSTADIKTIDELLPYVKEFSIFYHSTFIETFSEIAHRYPEKFNELLVSKFNKKSMEYAVECLEKMPNKETIKKITNALKSNDPAGIETAKALVAIESMEDTQKQFVEALLLEKEESIRSNAVMKLEKRTNYENISLSMTTNSAIIFLNTIMHLPKIDDELKHILMRFLYFPEKRVQLAIMDIIIKFRIFECEEYFNHILKHGDTALIKATLNVIGKTNMRTFIALLRDKFIISDNKDFIVSTIHTFADMRLERTVEILVELLKDPKYGEYEEDILEALSNIKHKLLPDIFKKVYAETQNINKKIIAIRGLMKNGCENELTDLTGYAGDTKYLPKIMSVIIDFKNMRLLRQFIEKKNEFDKATINIISNALEKLRPADLFTEELIEIYKKHFM